MAVVVVMDISNTMTYAFGSTRRAEVGSRKYDAAMESAATFIDSFAANASDSSQIGYVAFNTDAHQIMQLRSCSTGDADIVKNQIKIAAGEELKIKQKEIEFKGHAIECRINAENPSKNFRPCPGTITGLNLPGGKGIRIDSAIYEGYTIPPTYDSMIAKIIAYGANRNEAISKMKRALEETVIEGIDTNIDFLLEIIKNKNFIRGDYDTSFIEVNF